VLCATLPKHILEGAIHRALGSLFALAPREVLRFAELMLLRTSMTSISSVEKTTPVRFAQVGIFGMHTLSQEVPG
jgi:glycerol-3-phosphate acyltransferase PlsY